MYLNEYLKWNNDIVDHIFEIGNYIIVHTNSNNNLFINTKTEKIDAMLKGVSIDPDDLVTKEQVEQMEKEFVQRQRLRKQIDELVEIKGE